MTKGNISKDYMAEDMELADQIITKFFSRRNIEKDYKRKGRRGTYKPPKK